MNFFELSGISRNFLKVGFIIKLLAGIALGLIYTYYYTDRLTADTFKFFDDSEILFNSIKASPFDYIRMLTGIQASSMQLQHYYDSMTNWYDTFSPFNDNRTMIRLNAFLRLFSMGYYYVHVVFVSFLSFLGIIAIVKVFKEEFPDLTKEILLIFLLLPSVLFWGSGLLKDSLVFFTFGMLLLSFSHIVKVSKIKFGALLFFLVFLFLLMMTKFQIFLISIPLLISWRTAQRSALNPVIVFSGISLVYFAIIYLIPFVWPGCDTVQLLIAKQKAFINLATTSEAGSIISVPTLKPTLLNLLINGCIGFTTSITRPFISDSGAVLNTISAIENTIILLFGVYCILNIKLQNLKGKVLPVFCLFYLLFSFTLIGMITPVLGAIVRYKAQALPFMVVLLILISQPSGKILLNKLIPKSIK